MDIWAELNGSLWPTADVQEELSAWTTNARLGDNRTSPSPAELARASGLLRAVVGAITARAAIESLAGVLEEAQLLPVGAQRQLEIL